MISLFCMLNFGFMARWRTMRQDRLFKKAKKHYIIQLQLVDFYILYKFYKTFVMSAVG